MQQLCTTLLRFLSITFLFTLLAGRADAAESNYRRTIEQYTLPDVVLVNQDGVKVSLTAYIQSGKPVVVDFIFCTCTTVCPILSAGYVNLQQNLGSDSHNVKLISISIDPENDTPKAMKQYLKKYRAQPGWDFLTGSRADVDKVMQAFNAYIPNKTLQLPLTLIRSPADGKWVRIFGLMSSSEFLSEYKKAGTK